MDIQEVLIDHNKDRFVVRYTNGESTAEFTFDSKAEAEDDIESWLNPSHGALNPGDCATLYQLIKIKQTYMA